MKESPTIEIHLCKNTYYIIALYIPNYEKDKEKYSAHMKYLGCHRLCFLSKYYPEELMETYDLNNRRANRAGSEINSAEEEEQNPK